MQSVHSASFKYGAPILRFWGDARRAEQQDGARSNSVNSTDPASLHESMLTELRRKADAHSPVNATAAQRQAKFEGLKRELDAFGEPIVRHTLSADGKKSLSVLITREGAYPADEKYRLVSPSGLKAVAEFSLSFRNREPGSKSGAYVLLEGLKGINPDKPDLALLTVVYQLAVERSLQVGSGGNVETLSPVNMLTLHYKAGFRPVKHHLFPIVKVDSSNTINRLDSLKACAPYSEYAREELEKVKSEYMKLCPREVGQRTKRAMVLAILPECVGRRIPSMDFNHHSEALALKGFSSIMLKSAAKSLLAGVCGDESEKRVRQTKLEKYKRMRKDLPKPVGVITVTDQVTRQPARVVLATSNLDYPKIDKVESCALYGEDGSRLGRIQEISFSPPNADNPNGGIIVGGLDTLDGKDIYKGLGSALMRWVVLRSFQAGFGGRVELDATPTALGFYYKLGFRATGTPTFCVSGGTLDDQANQQIAEAVQKAKAEGTQPDTGHIDYQHMILPDAAIERYRREFAERGFFEGGEPVRF